MDTSNAMPVVKAAALILLGGGIFAFLLWKTPLIECLYLFTYIVLVPLAFFASIGLVSRGTLDLLLMGASDFRMRVWEQYERLQYETAASQSNAA